MISLGQILNPQPSSHNIGQERSSHAPSRSHAERGEGIGAGDRGVGRPEHSSHRFSARDVHEAQKTVEDQLKSKMNIQLSSLHPEAVELLAPVSDAGSESDDFSPEAVTDRIMGFIESRIDAARANGADEEELQSMFGQALKGLEQGLKEAKEVITALDSFDGEVKDTFFETVSLLDERMGALEESLFGAKEADSLQDVDDSAGTGAPPPLRTLDLDNAFSSIPRGNERYVAQSNALFFSQDSQFDMEVVTQDGDVVTIHVGAGESHDFRSGEITSDQGSLSAYQYQQSSYYELSFSVEGELDEGEMEALNDLFSQVNEVADTFYTGDVGKAFEQALAVGYDSEELAAFAVNMTHTEVVAVTQAYKEVATLDKEPAANPLQSMMDTLSDFASQVRNAHEQLFANPDRPNNHQGLYTDLLEQLVPPEDVPSSDEGNKDVFGGDIHDAFKGFIDSILRQ